MPSLLKPITLLPLLALAAGLAGCASQVPDPIRIAPQVMLSIDEVRQQPDRFVGQTVRWGGRIIQTQNLPQRTRIVILASDLAKDGYPVEGDARQGRFIAHLKGFLEPSLFAPGREITVRGTLAAPITENIGEYPYTYPVVEVQHHYLWPVPEEPLDYDWYPWYPYYPWYPWHPWYGPHPYY